MAVVGTETCAQTLAVCQAVRRAGGRPVLVETAPLPDDEPLAFEDGAVRYRGERLDDVGVFYVKSIQLRVPTPDPVELPRRNFPSWLDRYTAERERHSFLASVIGSLDDGGRAFVNPLAAVDLHLKKLEQLARLRELGVPVPSTLATSDPEAVLAFADRHGSLIVKPLSGGALVERVTPAMLEPEHLATLAHCPALLQEEVRGPEVRAFLLEGEPVAAFAIPTDGPGGPVDARLNLDRATWTDLDDDVWALLTYAADHLGLVFTAADVRLHPERGPVVLELNPTPATTFYDEAVVRAGGPDDLVVDRLAEHLVACAR